MSRVWRSPTPRGAARQLEPGLVIMAQTILGEAEAEDYTGKLAVAFSIVNRKNDSRWPDDSGSVCLQSMQYSCWNAGSNRLSAMQDPKARTTEEVWDDCFKAAMAAEFGLETDPTCGANHYLNVEVTKKISGGSLPSWFDEEKVTVVLGEHTFLKL